MHRREILKLAALSAAAAALDITSAALEPLPATGPIPIIDAHIHLFDPLRPGGVPWPLKTDTLLYKPALPARYAALSAPYGVVGAIAIEASPLPSDNQWLLNVAANNPLIVGIIGDLVPSSPTFQQDLDRLHGDQLFLGIRYGNLWNRDLSVDLESLGFIEGVKALASAGLVFETANPDPRLIGTQLSKWPSAFPTSALSSTICPTRPSPRKKTRRTNTGRTCACLPRVLASSSSSPRFPSSRTRSSSPTRAFTRPPSTLSGTSLVKTGYVLFGSDWPNSDNVSTYAQTFSIVRAYMARKSYAAREKYFWKNSLAAYRWTKRKSDQPSL